VGQFLISTEVFASLLIFGFLAMVAALALAPAEDRIRLRSTAGWSALAAAVTALVMSPYIAYALTYPVANRHVGGSDLLSFFVPRTRTLIGGGLFAGLTSKFPRSPVENGAYVGLPLLFALTHFTMTEWRRWTTRLIAAMFVLVVVATLGPRLVVNRRQTVALPWKLIQELPLLRESAPNRYTVYAFLLEGVAVTLWLARRPGSLRRWSVAVLGAFLLLPSSIHRSSVPEGATRVTAANLERSFQGQTVLILPGNDGKNMFWQSETWFAFRMVTGYTGNVKPPEYRHSRVLQSLYRGTIRFPDGTAFLAFLRAYHVQAILIGEDDQPRRQRIVSLLGLEPTRLDHMLVFRVPASTTTGQ
jgi:hypothetical protein